MEVILPAILAIHCAVCVSAAAYFLLHRRSPGKPRPREGAAEIVILAVSPVLMPLVLLIVLAAVTGEILKR